MAAKGYCTVVDVESFLAQSFTSAQLVQCSSLIERVEAEIDEYTGRAWLTGAVTDEAYFYPSAHLFLRYAPVTSIQAVGGITGMGESETALVAGTDYEVRSLQHGHLYFVTPGAYYKILVDYTPVASMPADLTQATVEMVAARMQSSLQPGSFGLDSVQLPDYTVRYARSHVQEAMPPTAKEIIDRYRYVVHA